MADVFTRAKRSQVMARIRSSGNKDTEIRLISVLRANRLTGWRRRWPIFGRPDFVFPKIKVAVFVDGCFWHGCPKCYRAPKTNGPYWRLKIARNRKRDLKVKGELRKQGWIVLRFWECHLKDSVRIATRIRKAVNWSQNVPLVVSCRNLPACRATNRNDGA